MSGSIKKKEEQNIEEIKKELMRNSKKNLKSPLKLKKYVDSLLENSWGENCLVLHSSYFALLNKYQDESIIANILRGLIALHEADCKEETYWTGFGYRYAGVIAAGYLQWLESQIKTHDIKRVYFVIPKNNSLMSMFKKLCPHYDVNALYMAPALFEGECKEKIIEEYLLQSGIFDDKCVLVDLGWDKTIIKAVEDIGKKVERNPKVIGLSLAVKMDDCDVPNIKGYLMDNGILTDDSTRCPFDEYIVALLDLMFCASEEDLVEIRKIEDDFVPIYRRLLKGEITRREAGKELVRGVKQFVSDIHPFITDLSLKINSAQSFWVLEYLSCSASPYEMQKISTVGRLQGNGKDSFMVPITRNPRFQFNLIVTWPDQMSAETEIAHRVVMAAQECGMLCIPIDKNGYILDSEFHRTNQCANRSSFTIVECNHTPKLFDSFYYLPLWNPPDYFLRDLNILPQSKDNYLSYDDFLLLHKQEHGNIWNHFKMMWVDRPRNMDNASVFMTSLPAGLAITPKLPDIPKLFYCGMNWEKLFGTKGRHEGLLKRLDDKGVIKIFGPSENPAWGGIHPWEGYECYQYPIPFDGVSLLKELHDCGVCLALSSAQHRKSKVLSNRIYEACTAGVLTITDEHPLAREMFGDTLLYVDSDPNDPESTYKQVMKHYKWVLEHREQAQKMAERAQHIFLENYTLNHDLKNIVENHANRVKAAEEDLFAQNDKEIVLVAYVCNGKSLEEAKNLVEKILKNISCQIYRSIIPVIGLDKSITDEMRDFCNSIYAATKVMPFAMYDKHGSRDMSDGQVIAQLRNVVPHEYFIITNADEIWFSDHVTTLVRSLEDDERAMIAHAAQVVQSESGERSFHSFENFKEEDLLDVCQEGTPVQIKYPYPGCFLFRSECHNAMPDFLFDWLDGREYVAYLFVMLLKHNSKIVFTRRVTFEFGVAFIDSHHVMVSKEWEKRFILDLVKYEIMSRGLHANLTPIQESALETPSVETISSYENMSDLMVPIVRGSSIMENIYSRFVFPWKSVEPGSRIVIYGGGTVGITFLKQIVRCNYCTVTAICDRDPEGTGIVAAPVISIDELAGWDYSKYDLILVAIEKQYIAQEIMNNLIMAGIPVEKIKWVDPRK